MEISNSVVSPDFALNSQSIDALYLNNVEGALDIIPLNIRKLSLSNCNINSVKDFNKYSNLEYLNLDKTNIGIDAIDDLRNLASRVFIISFDDTEAEKFLSSQEVKIEDEQVLSNIKSIFNVWRSGPINEYSLFGKHGKASIEINDKETLEALISSGLINRIQSEDVTLNIGSFERIEIDDLKDYLSKIKCIKINSFRGLTDEKLDALSNINWIIENDQMTSDVEKRYYDSDKMKSILKKMNKIKNAIPNDATDLEKFLIVYKSLGSYIKYDRSGNDNDPNYSKENRMIARSLYGALNYGRASCPGYAIACKYCLDYIANLDTNIIHGFACGDESLGHNWFQVKVDGNWYNSDLTWDYKDILNERPLDYCLKSDEEFYKDHTPRKI